MLAARHSRDRQHESALPARFAEPSGARAAVLAAWHETDASGVVALRDGHLVGTALTAHALREAHAAGYVASLTDWRVTNLQASRLWPQLGFRPFQYRLHRLIDHRIAWASG